MYAIINLITNALSFLNSKKVQSIIFLVLLFIAIGIFIFIFSIIHHTLFSYLYLIIISFLSFLLTIFGVFYAKTDDRIIAITEKLFNENFKPTEVENRSVINEHLKGITTTYCLNENSDNIITYFYKHENVIREKDLFNPNRKLNRIQKRKLKEYYSKMDRYIIDEKNLTSEIFAQLFCDEKQLSSNQKIKLKKEVSLIDIGDILSDLNKLTKIHKSQIVKLFTKYNQKSQQYEDINLHSLKSAMSRYKKIVNQ